jgi:uncharacterized protein (UPF0548 family)
VPSANLNITSAERLALTFTALAQGLAAAVQNRFVN